LERAMSAAEIEVKTAVPVNVGLAENTALPVPVLVVSAARRLAEEGVARKVATPAPRPETPVPIGRPVAFVSVPDAGVPSAPPETRMFAPSIAATPAETRVIVVSLACPSSIDPTPRAVTVEAVSPAMGSPVALVSVPLDGVPRGPPE